jgi:hypothetical protein
MDEHFHLKQETLISIHSIVLTSSIWLRHLIGSLDFIPVLMISSNPLVSTFVQNSWNLVFKACCVDWLQDPCRFYLVDAKNNILQFSATGLRSASRLKSFVRYDLHFLEIEVLHFWLHLHSGSSLLVDRGRVFGDWRFVSPVWPSSFFFIYGIEVSFLCFVVFLLWI